MKHYFDQICARTGRMVTRKYSTSFSLGIQCLHGKYHAPIYAVYAFVRFADEIVDSFHDYDKALLLAEFRDDTYKAIDRKISMNPVLNAFQETVHRYHIERELIDCFLDSMEMDLAMSDHSAVSLEQYILGSAEVVGLMCLRIFTEGNDEQYQTLKPYAMRLGAAFQKVNFLRDLKDDSANLGRKYFPGLDVRNFCEVRKAEIEHEIQNDFDEALKGVKMLPAGARFGVYVAYVYYKALFSKIRSVPSARMLNERIRINNYRKIGLLAGSYLKHSMGLI